jgi:hypothetical protein
MVMMIMPTVSVFAIPHGVRGSVCAPAPLCAPIGRHV